MKWKSVVLVVAVLTLLALGLSACGPEIEERAIATVSSPEVEESPTETPDDSDIDKSEITTESGLQYTEIERGDGPVPEVGDIVTVQYIAWLEDGTELGNTYETGQPASFFLGQGIVIKGWDEGIALMNQGGKAKLVLPPALALGETGSADGQVPPNATLVFEVELISVYKGVPEAPTPVEEEDYVTTDSGLKYYDFVVGEGTSPETGQSVAVHYTGWLEDGTKFDSSLDRLQPIAFAIGLGKVIAGWDEGVSTMKVGGKRQLVIPSELGYGEPGYSGVIPPNATLIFEVELLAVR